jgi:hypothetical protein
VRPAALDATASIPPKSVSADHGERLPPHSTAVGFRRQRGQSTIRAQPVPFFGFVR